MELTYEWKCYLNRIEFELLFCRHWLFGEKVQISEIRNGKNGKSEHDKLISGQSRIRGWFPRKCAVELVNPDSDEEQDHFTSKKNN